MFFNKYQHKTSTYQRKHVFIVITHAPRATAAGCAPFVDSVEVHCHIVLVSRKISVLPHRKADRKRIRSKKMNVNKLPHHDQAGLLVCVVCVVCVILQLRAVQKHYRLI